MDTTCRVLIVDDYSAMGRMLRRSLREVGFKAVDLATTGAAALARLRGKRYGLVFSGLKLKPMSGLDLARFMRADPSLKSLPVIALADEATPDAERAAKQAGISDTIVKGFTIDTVRKKIVAALGG